MESHQASTMQDQKTKNEHFQEMFLRAHTDKNLPCRTILFDSWYGSVANLKLVHRIDRLDIFHDSEKQPQGEPE